MAARIVMAEFGWETSWWDRYFDFLATFFLVALGARAKFELSQADAADDARRLTRKAASEDAPKPAFWAPLSYNPDGHTAEAEGAAERGSAQSDYGYGSVTAARPTGATKESMAGDVLSMLAAFVIPLVVVFCAEAEDKSMGVLDDMHATLTPGSILGAVVGFSLAAALSVFAGFLFERQFNDGRLLFTVVFVCFSLALVSLSQGLQQLPALRSPGTSSMMSHAQKFAALLQLRSFP